MPSSHRATTSPRHVQSAALFGPQSWPGFFQPPPPPAPAQSPASLQPKHTREQGAVAQDMLPCVHMRCGRGRGKDAAGGTGLTEGVEGDVGGRTWCCASTSATWYRPLSPSSGPRTSAGGIPFPPPSPSPLPYPPRSDPAPPRAADQARAPLTSASGTAARPSV